MQYSKFTYTIFIILNTINSSNCFLTNESKDSELISQFIDFQLKFKKNYLDKDEFDYRLKIFSNNLKKISNHNLNNNHSFKLGVNQYADLLPYEFNLHKGYINDILYKFNSYIDRFINNNHVICEQFKSNSDKLLPESIDWREYGIVTNVKNQGKCGSCWSFSTTGAIEGAWAIKHNLTSLSEQQLIDCSRTYGDLGCHGGLMDNAFSYAIDNGMCSEQDYKYQAKGQLCHQCNKTVFLSGCVDVTSGNEVHLKEAVARGPVSVAIEADKEVFQLYSSGVITSDKCGINLDHGVLIVGYGIENNIPYWLVKNSWGEEWGDNGYVKIERSDDINGDGTCGIALQASYPVI